MGRVKRKKTRSPKYVVEQPSAKLSSHRKKSSDPSHRKTAADIFKEDPSAIDRVQSLRLYDEDDSYDREAIDRVQTSETPEKPPTGSSVISSQVDQIGTEAVKLGSVTGIVTNWKQINRVHSLGRVQKDRVQTSETPEKPPTGSSVVSSPVDQIGTEVVKLRSVTGIVTNWKQINRVHSLRFYNTDDSHDREEKDRVHSLRFYKTDDSETPDFPKLSEKPPHGVISSQVNQTGTVSEVVKMAKDAQGSVVMSQQVGKPMFLSLPIAEEND